LTSEVKLRAYLTQGVKYALSPVSKLMFNIVIAWTKDQIVVVKGLYIEIQNKASIQNGIYAKQRMTLYPAYKAWCKRQGYKPIFRQKLGMGISKVTKISKAFFRGVHSQKLLTLRFIKDKTFRPLTLGEGLTLLYKSKVRKRSKAVSQFLPMGKN